MEIPFFDPERFFEELFGKESDADRQTLEKVKISLQEERRWGDLAVRAYLDSLRRQKIAVTTRGKDVAYVRKLVELLRPCMQNGDRYPVFKIYVAESTHIDARCFPGGALIFSRGLIEAAESEAALAAMAGHELSHLDRGRVLAPLRRIKLAEQTFSGSAAGFSPQRFLANGRVLLKMFTRPFRPEYEAEADRDGAAWAYQTGYDPREMASLFLKVRERSGGRDSAIPEFFRSHPPYLDRRQAVMALFEEMQRAEPKDKLYVGKENLHRRIPRDEQRFSEAD